ncbi:hypothetical protein EMCRGX_G014783 [Ephydatia muelleri]|eukprot:Em0005g1211a
MRRFLLCVLFGLLCTTSIAKKKPKGVEIITESKPDDCKEFSEKGDTILVHYTGALESGQVFDSSRATGREPFSLVLGTGQVIKGWEDGLLGMCVGEMRRLIIQPEMAYGKAGVEGVIPGDAVLLFSVELLDLKKRSILSVPQGSGFYTAVGVAVLIGLGAYELYRRAKQETAKPAKSKEHSNTRVQQKKKSKRKD